MSQLERVKVRLKITGNSEDILIQEFLDSAKSDIMNRRYPYGTTETELESQYLTLQVELAIIKYNMMGVEGQATHSENGISRTYSNKLMDAVVPKVGTL